MMSSKLKGLDFLRKVSVVMLIVIGAFFTCIFTTVYSNKAVSATVISDDGDGEDDGEDDDGKCTVKIKGGKIDGSKSEESFKTGNIIRITADPAPEGMRFKCWHISASDGTEYTDVIYSDAVDTSEKFYGRTFVFIGDSYQYGTMEDKSIFSWLDYLLLRHSSNMDMYYRNDVGGYGFAKPDMYFITLLQEVEESVGNKMNVTDVVTVGSFNDRNYVSDIDGRIEEYISYVRATYPNARIWILPADGTTNEGYRINTLKACEQYAASAEKYGALTDHELWHVVMNDDLMCVDTVHPSGDGQVALSYQIENLLAYGKVNESYNTVGFVSGTMAESEVAFITLPEEDISIFAEYEEYDAEIDTNITGLYELDYYNDKNWCYYEAGLFMKAYRGLVKGTINGESALWYVNYGVVDENYNGLVEREGVYWYVKDGRVDESFTSVVHGRAYGETAWWYVKNGKFDPKYIGFEKNENGWWYCKNGKVDFETEGVIKGTVNNETGWWRVKGSKVDFGYTGFAENENGWWYIEKGKVSFSKNDVIKGTVKGETAWWCVKGGKVEFINTIAKNKSGWWKITNGKVDFNFTGITKNESGWWRIVNGKVDFNCNSIEKNEYGWWKLKGGKIDFNFNGIARNENGWWKCKDGKVDFSFNGIARNENGWWKCKGGKIDFNFDGIAQNENGWWKFKGGKIDFGYTGLAKNENGWWYCKNGKIDFSYTGFAKNNNGWWYCRNGQVDFKMKSLIKGTIDGETRLWNVVNGKVEN